MLIEDTIFVSPTGDGPAILREAKKFPSFFSHFKTLNIGPTLGIEHAAFRDLQSCALSTELVLPRSDMEDGRLGKDFLFRELTSGSRPVGYPILRYKDVCKRDTKSAEIDPESQGWSCS